jgi:hypothetical protein
MDFLSKTEPKMTAKNNDTKKLTVKSVCDLRLSDGYRLLDAEAWLESLTEAGYSDLRAATTGYAGKTGPIIVCAECDWPVYAPDNGTNRRRYFQHKKGFPLSCCYSGDEGKDPRQVDADKFNGQQEGERHKQLKNWLLEIISFSNTATGIAKERDIRLSDKTFARPDVYADIWLGAPIAFDIQLATTQITTIVRREEFYSRGGIRYVWITDRDKYQLVNRSFRDIYMRNDGQIFGIDEDVLKKARDQKAPFFRILRLVPDLASAGFKPKFKDRICSVDEINWGNPGSRPRSNLGSFDDLVKIRCEKDLFISNKRSEFFGALANEDARNAGFIWDEVQKYVGGLTWGQLPCEPYQAMRALGCNCSRSGLITRRSEGAAKRLSP